MDEPNWIVEFYETASGEKPVLDFINTFDVKLKAKKYREDYLKRNPVAGGTK